mmetsp:Transcript_5669/g.14747  ORF Transcript_5669/g.14747 Transcript_5669/m.14747 type:complete len:243 (+) Transcript_5669:229-957(+)
MPLAARYRDSAARLAARIARPCRSRCWRGRRGILAAGREPSRRGGYRGAAGRGSGASAQAEAPPAGRSRVRAPPGVQQERGAVFHPAGQGAGGGAAGAQGGRAGEGRRQGGAHCVGAKVRVPRGDQAGGGLPAVGDRCCWEGGARRRPVHRRLHRLPVAAGGGPSVRRGRGARAGCGEAAAGPAPGGHGEDQPAAPHRARPARERGHRHAGPLLHLRAQGDAGGARGAAHGRADGGAGEAAV